MTLSNHGKKVWMTPTVDEAPVQMTESGFISTTFETFIVFNDSKAGDKDPGSPS